MVFLSFLYRLPERNFFQAVNGKVLEKTFRGLKGLEESMNKSEFLYLIKNPEGLGFDVAVLHGDPSLLRHAKNIRHWNDEHSAKKFFAGLVDRVKAIPKWVIRQGERFVETDEDWKPLGAHSAATKMFKIILTRERKEPEISEENFPKVEAIRVAKDTLEAYRFPMSVQADIIDEEGVLVERFSGGWPDGKVRRIAIHGKPARYDLNTLEITGSWKVALGRRGYRRLLTEKSWSTKKAAKEAAGKYLENHGVWDSAIVVSQAEVVAQRYLEKRATVCPTGK